MDFFANGIDQLHPREDPLHDECRGSLWRKKVMKYGFDSSLKIEIRPSFNLKRRDFTKLGDINRDKGV